MIKKDKTFNLGCKLLHCWSGINLFFSSLILFIVTTGISNSPLFAMVFTSSEVSELPLKVIKAMNCLTILYNSYAVAMSIMVWFVVKKALKNKERWAFWALLITIGIVEVFAFIASAPFNHTRWQVNVGLTLLYLIGMFLVGRKYYGKEV